MVMLICGVFLLLYAVRLSLGLIWMPQVPMVMVMDYHCRCYETDGSMNLLLVLFISSSMLNDAVSDSVVRIAVMVILLQNEQQTHLSHTHEIVILKRFSQVPLACLLLRRMELQLTL